MPLINYYLCDPKYQVHQDQVQEATSQWLFICICIFILIRVLVLLIFFLKRIQRIHQSTSSSSSGSEATRVSSSNSVINGGIHPSHKAKSRRSRIKNKNNSKTMLRQSKIKQDSNARKAIKVTIPGANAPWSCQSQQYGTGQGTFILYIRRRASQQSYHGCVYIHKDNTNML